MTFITHPLHRNTEICIFRRKTHTSFTMSNFLSFHKTTRKMTSTLWAPSSHIFYSIKSCRPFMTFSTSPKHWSIYINIFDRNALTASFLCDTVCYINIKSSFLSLYWNKFLVRYIHLWHQVPLRISFTEAFHLWSSLYFHSSINILSWKAFTFFITYNFFSNI